MKNVKNRYSKVTIIPVTLGLIMLALFYSSQTRLEKIMVGGMFVMILFPFMLQLLTLLLFSASPKPQAQRIAENIISGNYGEDNSRIELKEGGIETKEGSIKKHYKAKTNNNPYYQETRERLIGAVKGGNLDRDAILKIRLELDNRLGANRYSYSNFTFENDMHEIYIKLKSSKLKDDDYTYLKSIIEDLVV